LAGVSGRETLYLGSIVMIQINPLLFAAVGGQDGVDGVGAPWMTYSINRKHHQFWLSALFFIAKKMYIGRYNAYISIALFLCIGGGRNS
jgi:hypothetical protein